jgi:hypothetical protein
MKVGDNCCEVEYGVNVVVDDAWQTSKFGRKRHHVGGSGFITQTHHDGGVYVITIINSCKW